MTKPMSPEYRQLALDSSNEMNECDSRRVLGRYPQAAWHMREAGFGRVRMGQIMFDEGDYVQAAADWLSAAECFYLSTDQARMMQCMEQVRQLDRAGHIPPERRDIHAAIREREEQFRTLEAKRAQFWRDYRQLVGPMRAVSPETLDFLLRQVRELPGYPHLHAEISYQAMNLGRWDLAQQSLDWASRFDPGSPHLAALQVSQAFARGDSVRAAQVARESLVAHPEMGYLRILLAQALAFRAGSRAADWNPADWEAAIEILGPLIETGSADILERLTSISLAATLHHGLGHEVEYRRLLESFDTLAATTQAPVGQELVMRLRRDLPQVFPQPGSGGVGPSTAEAGHPLTEPDYFTVRRLFPLPGALAVGAGA